MCESCLLARFLFERVAPDRWSALISKFENRGVKIPEAVYEARDAHERAERSRKTNESGNVESPKIEDKQFEDVDQLTKDLEETHLEERKDQQAAKKGKKNRKQKGKK
jgi:hypothetical protein